MVTYVPSRMIVLDRIPLTDACKFNNADVVEWYTRYVEGVVVARP